MPSWMMNEAVMSQGMSHSKKIFSALLARKRGFEQIFGGRHVAPGHGGGPTKGWPDTVTELPVKETGALNDVEDHKNVRCFDSQSSPFVS